MGVGVEEEELDDQGTAWVIFKGLSKATGW
jgi:hypothetical protein